MSCCFHQATPILLDGGRKNCRRDNQSNANYKCNDYGCVFHRIIELLPESPAFYPKDQLTDKPERFFINETIREKILLHYKKEIPYAVEIETEEFFEEEKIIRMRSVIMVERETQKGILIGHKGTALKRVGVEARKDLEKFFGKQIHLELYVKVNKNWRNDQRQLKRFGYNQK